MLITSNIYFKIKQLWVLLLLVVIFVGCSSKTTRLSNKTTASKRNTSIAKKHDNPLTSWNKSKSEPVTIKSNVPQTTDKSNLEYKSPTIAGYTPPEPFNPNSVNQNSDPLEGVTGEEPKSLNDLNYSNDNDTYTPPKMNQKKSYFKNISSKNRSKLVYKSSNSQSNLPIKQYSVKKVQYVKVVPKSIIESPKQLALKAEKNLEMQQLFIDGVTASRTGNNKKAISNMRQVLISGNSDLKKKAKIYYSRSIQNPSR